jgi:hypothetical protein
VTTLEEVERHYTLMDLYDANEALDINEEMQEWANSQTP